MVSREQKRAAALHEKLQLLRSITKSHAVILCSILHIYLYLYDKYIYIKRNYYSSSCFFLVFLLEKKYLHSFDINYSFPWLSLSYVSIPSSSTPRLKEGLNMTLI